MREDDIEYLSMCILCAAKEPRAIDRRSNLYRCEKCGLVFDNPRPTTSALKAYYSRPDKYGRWIARERARDGLWRRRLRKMIAVTEGGSLLDVGAGIGQFLYHARRYFSPVNGTEISESAHLVAREKYGIPMIRGSIDAVDFGATTFDVITMFHVLEHVPFPAVFLHRARELLSPGGTLFIAVPNELWSLRGIIKNGIKKVGRAAGIPRFAQYGKYGFSKIEFNRSHDEVHLSHFTAKNLSDALQQCGLGIIDCSLDPFYAVPWPINWLEAAYYLALSMFNTLTRCNLYDTIWIAARKPCPAEQHDRVQQLSSLAGAK